MVLHPQQAGEVLAVLDWELSTLGYPLADLAYSAMPYRLASGSLGLAGLPNPLPEGALICSRHGCLAAARRDGILCLSQHWRGTGLIKGSTCSCRCQTPGCPLCIQLFSHRRIHMPMQRTVSAVLQSAESSVVQSAGRDEGLHIARINAGLHTVSICSCHLLLQPGWLS